MVFLLKPLALLSLATYCSPGVCCGQKGILNVVGTHQAAPSGGCGRRHHERAKYFSDNHPLEPNFHLTLRRSSWLQTENDNDEEDKHEKKEEHEDDKAKKHKEKRTARKKAKPRGPASFFPDLFEKAFDLSTKATRELDKCLQLMDDIKGDIDSIPHDESKLPVLSAHVKIEVGNKDLSIHDLVKDMRDAVEKIHHLEGYLSSAKTQVNAKLRKVLPHPAEE